ncbi:MAG: hypothetical protein JWQ38_1722 [Flavipsychrobacter sp.]|nr:hypothetical protein [Flavipsychrobacter sp.]
MKKINIIYWISTILFALLMLASAMPDVLKLPDAVKFMAMLGYPAYFTPFIGWAKVLGCVAILVPGFPRIKEWAYAGLFFDLIGATYSQLAIGPFNPQMLIMLVWILPGVVSYMYYHKRQQALGK